MKKVKSMQNVVCLKHGNQFTVMKDNHKLFVCEIEGVFGQNDYKIIENNSKVKCDILRISKTEQVCFDNKKIYCNVGLFLEEGEPEEKVANNATTMLNILKKQIVEEHTKMQSAQKAFIKNASEDNNVALQVAINRYNALQDLYIAYNGKVYKF
jgi:hypothetical protein